MTTQTWTEAEAFHRFPGERLQQGGRDVSVELPLLEFRAWQCDRDRLRAELQPLLERAARGEGREIDFDELKAKGRERLAGYF